MNPHPIPDCPAGKTLEERVHWLEVMLAQLWDQVWWMRLPEADRKAYQAQGFTDPIPKFYRE